MTLNYDQQSLFFLIQVSWPGWCRLYVGFSLAVLIVHEAVIGFVAARLTKNAVWMPDSRVLFLPTAWRLEWMRPMTTTL